MEEIYTVGVIVVTTVKGDEANIIQEKSIGTNLLGVSVLKGGEVNIIKKHNLLAAAVG